MFNSQITPRKHASLMKKNGWHLYKEETNVNYPLERGRLKDYSGMGCLACQRFFSLLVVGGVFVCLFVCVLNMQQKKMIDLIFPFFFFYFLFLAQTFFPSFTSFQVAVIFGSCFTAHVVPLGTWELKSAVSPLLTAEVNSLKQTPRHHFSIK